MSEDEKIIEENIRKYIKEHSTTIKAYTQEYVDKKDKEIERLNNIINEIEKELNRDFKTHLHKDTTMRETGKTYKAGANNYRMHIYLKLKELKGEGI